MPPGAQLLVLAVLVLWAWIVAHLALLWRLLGVTEITTRWRWFALFPPVALGLGWMHGRRGHVVLWALLAVAYAGLRWGLATR